MNKNNMLKLPENTINIDEERNQLSVVRITQVYTHTHTRATKQVNMGETETRYVNYNVAQKTVLEEYRVTETTDPSSIQ